VHQGLRLRPTIRLIRNVRGFDTLFLKESLILFQPISQYFDFDALVSLFRRLHGVEDAFDIALDTTSTWPLPVALDLPFSASDAGESGSFVAACG